MVGPREGASWPSVPFAQVLPVLLMSVVWMSMLAWTPADSLRDDTLRFAQIAATPGVPYRDFPVEYAPLETLMIGVVAKGSLFAVAAKVALLNAASTLACWWLLRKHWSAMVGTLFAWFALPLQIFMPFRIDALSVLCAVGAVVLADRGKQRIGGVLAAVGVLFKIWPVLVLPVFVLRGRSRAAIVAVVSVVTGSMVWLWVTGTQALTDVTSFRGATGWQVESLPGLIVQGLHPASAFRLEAGTLRVGTMDPGAVLALRITTVVLVAAAYVVARRRPIDQAGAPLLAATSVTILLSPVLSPQYVCWLLPWAAIVAVERESDDVRILAFGASVFAALAFAVYWGLRIQPALAAASAGKIVCLSGLAVIGFTHARSDRYRDA